jgi:LytS/YehU family sensor histidine kinase
MIANLSDMLRYILYEGNRSLVPLSKEVELLHTYIGLERVRYGSGLDVHLDTPMIAEDLHIAPLILLPLVENCFKHGVSNIVENPWINMNISIDGDWMTMKLINGKAPGYSTEKSATGIGLKNVEKRLTLLYPGKHFIRLTDEEDVFIVDLKMELQRVVVKNKIFPSPEPIIANA